MHIDGNTLFYITKLTIVFIEYIYCSSRRTRTLTTLASLTFYELQKKKKKSKKLVQTQKLGSEHRMRGAVLRGQFL